MRTDNRSLVLATLGSLCTAAACTLITDVDRQKIKPPPSGEGGQGASGGASGRGGSAGKGGKGGDGAGGSTGGKGGAAGSAGTVQGGETGNAGEGGSPGTGGMGGLDAGAGGEAGAPAVCGNGVVEGVETCDDGNTASCGTCSADCSTAQNIPAGSDATITIGAGTNIADGDTITIGDGSNTAVFEFECDPLSDCPGAAAGVGSGNIAVLFNATNFDGMDDADEYRDLLVAAIDGSSLSTDAADGGAGLVTLEGVVTLSDTVGAPTFAVAARCRANRGCSADNVCLSNDCSSNVCQP